MLVGYVVPTRMNYDNETWPPFKPRLLEYQPAWATLWCLCVISLSNKGARTYEPVILNLVANGLEAMSGSGVLNIQISESVDEVVLTIRDHGCGMTPDVIANLYEPFFTEKLNGKGTGLGLSITHRIVGDHGGRIEATSDGVGQGSTFRVHLPRCAHPVNSSAA